MIHNLCKKQQRKKKEEKKERERKKERKRKKERRRRKKEIYNYATSQIFYIIYPLSDSKDIYNVTKYFNVILNCVFIK